MLARFVLYFGSTKDTRHVHLKIKDGQSAEEAAKQKAIEFGRLPVPPNDVQYAFVTND